MRSETSIGEEEVEMAQDRQTILMWGNVEWESVGNKPMGKIEM